MTFTAVWPIIDPNNLDAGGEMTVATDGDVSALIKSLSEPDAAAAMIEHQERLQVYSSHLREQAADHIMTAGVWQGYGYVTYADPDHEHCAIVGDPDSPMYSSEYEEYSPGSGVDLETFAAVLREFLATARRPTCVEWQKV